MDVRNVAQCNKEALRNPGIRKWPAVTSADYIGLLQCVLRYHLNHNRKELIVKLSQKVAAGIIAVFGLGLMAAASAGSMGGGMGNGMSGMGHGPMGGEGGPMAQLITPEERAAKMEKMRDAKTPEERHALMQAHHAEMQKRAAERGVTLPDHGGRGAGRQGPHNH